MIIINFPSFSCKMHNETPTPVLGDEIPKPITNYFN